MLGNLVLALAVIGYPLSASISQFVGIETNAINVSYRALVAALSISLGMWSFARGDYRINFILLLFLVLYTTRLISDLRFSQIPDVSSDSQFYFIVTLSSVISVGGAGAWYDEKTCLRMIIGIGAITCLLVTYNLAFNADKYLIEALGNRATFRFLNPISVGYLGLYTGFAAVIYIFKYSFWKRFGLLLLIAALGGYLFLAGGSRGPIVALVMALGLTGLANAKTARAYVLLGMASGLLLLFLGAPALILERFLSAGQDASSLERFQVVELSINALLAHPFFGSGYVEPVTNSYPHNLILEAGMALGFAGVVLMLYMQSSLVKGVWKLARDGEWLLPFLGATTFANAWISGSIWGSSLIFMVLWITHVRHRNLKTRQRSLIGAVSGPRHAHI
jgi:O-antigen ligase